MEQTNSKSKQSNILLVVLLLLALLVAGYYWNQNRVLKTVNQELTSTNQSLNVEMTALQDLRTDLLEDIEVLQTEYDELITSNDSLEVLFEAATSAIATKKAEIKKIKKDFAEDAAGMKAEVEQLRTIKKELTVLVGQLKAENAELKRSNQELMEEVSNVEAKNADLEFQITGLRSLNKDLEKEKKNMMATSTRASNILLDIRNKSDKPTGSARRVREITVSFDVKNIPDNKKGDHDIYVVIKDGKGLPVKVANPVKATIRSEVGGMSQEIIAQQMLTADLFEGVRRQFKIIPEVKSLHAGYYRISIYANWGLIGGAELYLR